MENNIEEEMLNNFKKEMNMENESCDCEDSNCECDCGCEDCDCDCEDCDCDCDCEDCDCGCDCCYEDWDDEEIDYDGTILDFCEEDFSPDIKTRGEEYYNLGKVGEVFKSGDIYKAKVCGTDIYDVEIGFDGYDVSYKCGCPCQYPCKHIYAVLLEISDGNYKEVELMEDTEEVVLSARELLEKVPAEELKEYILSDRSEDAVDFCLLRLNHEFEKYLPVQTYEYYYNNLYNSYVLDSVDNFFEYLDRIKEYIAKEKYEESFKIIKAMIEANYAATKYNESRLTSFYPNLAMYLRVTSRKGNEILKEEIKNWIKSLEEKKYYNDVYLEDFILGLYN